MLRALRSRRKVAAVVAALIVVALLFGLGMVIASGFNTGERSPGLAGEFTKASDAYRKALERFTSETRELGESPALKGALQVYGTMRGSLVKTKQAFENLEPPPEMQGAVRLIVTSLEEQVAALDRAREASRRGDAAGSNFSREQFLGAALVYQRARLQMESLIKRCGERCA